MPIGEIKLDNSNPTVDWGSACDGVKIAYSYSVPKATSGAHLVPSITNKLNSLQYLQLHRPLIKQLSNFGARCGLSIAFPTVWKVIFAVTMPDFYVTLLKCTSGWVFGAGIAAAEYWHAEILDSWGKVRVNTVRSMVQFAIPSCCGSRESNNVHTTKFNPSPRPRLAVPAPRPDNRNLRLRKWR